MEQAIAILGLLQLSFRSLGLVYICMCLMCLVVQYMAEPAEGTDLPGMSVIGCGYNVLNGYYADSRSCHYNLFQFPADDWEDVTVAAGKVFRKPRALTYQSSVTTSTEAAAGTSVRDFVEDINRKTKLEGSSLFFSASLAVDIQRSRAERSEYAFAKVQYDVGLYILRIPPNPRDFLHPDRRHEIDTAPDLTDLFDRYGTHYLNEMLIGGSATFSSTTNKLHLSSSSRTDISVAAQLTFKSLSGRLDASQQNQHQQTIKTFQDASEISMRTVGGSPALGGASFWSHADAWAESVLDFPEFANFVGDQSLVGIWTLASTPERAQQLHDFYPTYCRSKETPFPPPSGPLLQAKLMPLIATQYATDGLGEDSRMRLCRPDMGPGWFWLGQAALWNSDGCYGNTVIVREMVEGSGALGNVGHWEKVWDDTGSGKDLDYNMWRGVAANPADYDVLGDFFRGADGSNWRDLSSEDTAGITAVRKDCLVAGKWGSLVWHAEVRSRPVSAWHIVAADGSPGIETHLEPQFVSNNGWDAPSRPLSVLNRNMVAFVTGISNGAFKGAFKGSLTSTHLIRNLTLLLY